MSNWIDVSDKKPEPDQSVIVFPFIGIDSEDFSITGYVDCVGNWSSEEFKPITVTHWMPLPEIPTNKPASLPCDYKNPDWNNAGRVHDWKNYASDSLIESWNSMDDNQKMAIAESLQDVADREEWS